MEASVRDRDVVTNLRAARRRAVDLASTGQLEKLFINGTDSLEAQVYLVKLLDVYPGLGKVAGRRLMSEMGLSQFVRVADLTATHRAELLRACGEIHG